jgi:hypothetical protein
LVLVGVQEKLGVGVFVRVKVLVDVVGVYVFVGVKV